MKQPNFFLVGAPKAGTTSLYAYLDQHPQVYMSPLKEPNFFADELRPGNFSASERPRIAREMRALRIYLDGGARDKRFGGIITRWDDYLRLYDAVADERAIGEASACYLWSHSTAANIAARIPGARIIINLRNPIDRAYSQYLQMVTMGVTGRTFRQQIEANLRCQVRRFARINVPRACTAPAPRLRSDSAAVTIAIHQRRAAISIRGTRLPLERPGRRPAGVAGVDESTHNHLSASTARRPFRPRVHRSGARGSSARDSGTTTNTVAVRCSQSWGTVTSARPDELGCECDTREQRSMDGRLHLFAPAAPVYTAGEIFRSGSHACGAIATRCATLGCGETRQINQTFCQLIPLGPGAAPCEPAAPRLPP
jgi:hypothetical protein